MDPLAIYLLLFLAALTVCAFPVLLAPVAKRPCPQCGAAVALTRRVCSVCRHRFS